MSTIITKSRDFIVSVPLPESTDSYAPVPHREVIDFTMEKLDKAKMRIISEDYSYSREARQVIGRYTIANSNDPDMAIKIMWNNSYDKTMTLKWAIGAHVFVCGNGMVMGDMGMFKRKHTGSVLSDYEEAVGMYVNKAGEMFEQMIIEKKRMKEIECTKHTCAELVGRMFIEENLINLTQLGIIKGEIDNPSFDYEADGTVWQLYNHVTHSLKESHPTTYIPQHMKAHKFFTEEYSI